jgi:hypothetical protein
MSLAHFNEQDSTLSWIGVGNVGGILLGNNETGQRNTLLLRGGVVGQELPSLQQSILPLFPGDMLILTTDGIQEGFAEGLPPDVLPGFVAELILTRYSRSIDEALVLVARYKGAQQS